MQSDYNRFQRKNSHSNARVGDEFEKVAVRWLANQGLSVERNFTLMLGFANKKAHRFDLGGTSPPILVECKSHKWTEGDKTPSAKMTVWNEVMLYFSLAPPEYRKIIFVLKDLSKSRGETLAQYYSRTYAHLIPSNTQIWEYDEIQEYAQLVV